MNTAILTPSETQAPGTVVLSARPDAGGALRCYSGNTQISRAKYVELFQSGVTVQSILVPAPVVHATPVVPAAPAPLAAPVAPITPDKTGECLAATARKLTNKAIALGLMPKKSASTPYVLELKTVKSGETAFHVGLLAGPNKTFGASFRDLYIFKSSIRIYTADRTQANGWTALFSASTCRINVQTTRVNARGETVEMKGCVITVK